MGRSRYAVSISEEMPLGCKIYEPTHPYFVTCTVLNWLPIFTCKESAETLLKQFQFYKKAHKRDKEGYKPKLMQTDAMMLNKIQYIHENPLKRGYVDESSHWRYSSARDYAGISRLIEVDRYW